MLASFGLTVSALVVGLGADLALSSSVDLIVDWESFLTRSDMSWEWSSAASDIPNGFTTGPWAGNGLLGYISWQSNASSLYFELSRMDVYDDRPYSDRTKANFVCQQPRLPIASLEISWLGGLSSASARTSLWRGETTWSLKTQGGDSLDFRSLANADWKAADVMAFQFNASSSTAFSVSLKPKSAQSTWADRCPNYVMNPAADMLPLGLSDGHGTVLRQRHLTNTSHSTGIAMWQETATGAPGSADPSRSRLRGALNTNTGAYEVQLPAGASSAAIAISGVSPSFNASVAAVTKQLHLAMDLGFEGVRQANTVWWHEFWPAGGFITLNESIIESFYYQQIFKFASAASGDRRVVHDLQGPWFYEGTAWPDLHWDMNLQLTYTFPARANRHTLGDSLWTWLADVAPNFETNVNSSWTGAMAAPSGASSLNGIQTCYWNYARDTNNDCITGSPTITGNLLWVLQVVYEQYIRSTETSRSTIRQTVLQPMIPKAILFYKHMIELGAHNGDGVLHLPITFSPEYPGPHGTDTSYDLALLGWVLQTALGDASIGLQSHPDAPEWRSMQQHLTPLVQDDATGWYIARGIPLAVSHRHYSHLFKVWPLQTQDLRPLSEEEVEEEESLQGETGTGSLLGELEGLALARRSVDHWIGMTGALTGFCRGPVSAMSGLMGRPTSAWTNITYLVFNYMHPNTFYMESGGPCTETPNGAGMAIIESMLQVHNDTIHLYRGLLDTANSTSAESSHAAAFHQLSAPGGVLVTAKRGVVGSDSNPRTVLVGLDIDADAPPEGGWDAVRVAADMPSPTDGGWQLVYATPGLDPNSISVEVTPTRDLPDPVGQPYERITVTVRGLKPGQGASFSAAPAGDTTLKLGSDAPTMDAASGCESQMNYWGIHQATSTPSMAQIAPCDNGTSANASQHWQYDASTGRFLLSSSVTSAASGEGTLMCLSAPCSTGLKDARYGVDAPLYALSTVEECINQQAPSRRPDGHVQGQTDVVLEIGGSRMQAQAAFQGEMESSSASGINLPPGCFPSKQDQCNGLNQQWDVTDSKYNPGSQLIVSRLPSKQCLGVPGAEGPTLIMYACDDHFEQYDNEGFHVDDANKLLLSANNKPGWGPDFCVTAV